LRGICKQEGIASSERFFTPAEVYSADEAFASGSVKEIMAVRSLDGRAIGSGAPGPITRRLATAYKKYVQEYCAQAKAHSK
jgi:branched-subunit amino acid aminotransferase/4-amino-4-deoxychorismate lyase